jgi:hypothetical protein
MIPKLAHFYWYGERDMPELRAESLKSFERLNPGWVVNLHHSGEKADPTFVEIVTSSDAARYGILHRSGGVYFDTDIIFVRPIPDDWLDADVLLPCTENGQLYGIHVLGAKPNSPLFAEALRLCKLRMDSPMMLGCQSLGVKLWSDTNMLALCYGMNLSVGLVPRFSLLRSNPGSVEELWSNGGRVDHSEIGVHWYGGDRLSNQFENLPLDKLPSCRVKSAIEMSRA